MWKLRIIIILPSELPKGLNEFIYIESMTDNAWHKTQYMLPQTPIPLSSSQLHFHYYHSHLISTQHNTWYIAATQMSK